MDPAFTGVSSDVRDSIQAALDFGDRTDLCSNSTAPDFVEGSSSRPQIKDLGAAGVAASIGNIFDQRTMSGALEPIPPTSSTVAEGTDTANAFTFPLSADWSSALPGGMNEWANEWAD